MTTHTEALAAPRTEHGLTARLSLRSTTSWTLTCFAVDSAMLAVAVIAARLGADAAGLQSFATGWTVAFGLIALLLFGAGGLYAARLRLDALEDARSVLVQLTLAAMIVLALQILITTESSPAADVIRPWLFAAVYVTAGRIALYWSQATARRLGESSRPTLIVGAGKVGRLTAKRLLAHPEFGLRPVGFLDKEPLAEDDNPGLPVLGASWDLDRVVAEHAIEQVIVTFSTAPHEVLLRFVNRCEELGVSVALVPRLYEKTTKRLTVEHIGGLPLLSAHAADPKGWQFAIKYALDRVVAGVLLLMLLPVLATAALAVYVSVGRPIFFRQMRVGRDGNSFGILKFRSMKEASPDAATGHVLQEGSAPGGVEGEDRRTPVGTFLRKSSIDELPQLINVLKGDMSLVGPRPERPEYVDEFTRSVYRYGDRHRVKSGITGWSQVNGLRGKTSIADRAEWDNHYIENFSLWLDLKVLMLTALAVFKVFKSVE